MQTSGKKFIFTRNECRKTSLKAKYETCFSIFTASAENIQETILNIVTNERKLCKRMGKKLFLHAMSAAKLR